MNYKFCYKSSIAELPTHFYTSANHSFCIDILIKSTFYSSKVTKRKEKRTGHHRFKAKICVIPLLIHHSEMFSCVRKKCFFFFSFLFYTKMAISYEI